MCGVEKSLGQFHKRDDGVRNDCIDCRRAYDRQRPNKEQRKEYVRQWRIKNAEYVKARRIENEERSKIVAKLWRIKNAERLKAYQTANAESFKAYQARWYASNPDYDKAYGKQRRIKHRERDKAFIRRWEAAFPDKVKAKSQRRRARKIGAEGAHSGVEWRSLVDRFGGNCVRCKVHFGLKKLTADHIVPLAKGGSNFIENIQPLCRRCNSAKGLNSTDYRKTFTF